MNVLFVKLSSLGDVVHTMPVVQDVLRSRPDVTIDWVVERGFAALVQRSQGVRRVIESDLRGWRRQPLAEESRQGWQLFHQSLREQAYDAVIDLQGLTKSALVSRLARMAPAGLRFAMGNRTEGSSYELPSLWVADVALRLEPHVHAVTRSRLLCAMALDYALPGDLRYGLHTQPLVGELALTVAPQKPTVAFIHGTSRVDKEWPLAHWVSLGQQLNRAGWAVALPQGSEVERARSEQIAQALSDATVWPRLSLDQLSDALAQCAGAIGVDSGLSHIAVALDLPHVQLYNHDTAWRTGPLPGGRQCAVFTEGGPTVAAVWQAWCQMANATSTGAHD